jgi:hypothetical protein
VLTLTDGTTHAAVTMLGSYANGNFTLVADGNGGTLLTYHG